MSKSRGSIFVFSAIACGLAILGVVPVLTASSVRAQQPTEFKVGYVAALVGPLAELSRYYIEGLHAGVAMVNAQGGIAGLPVRLITCDSQSLEQQAVICAKRLINQDKVNLLLGGTGTPLTMAILPTVETSEIPLFSLAAGRQTFTPMKKWVFKGEFANDDQVPVYLDFAKKKGWTRAALIRDNGAFGKDTSDAVRTYAKQIGIEIIAEELYSPQDIDMTAQITRIRGINPDVVLNLASALPAGILVSKGIVQLGIKSPIIVQMNLQLDKYLELAAAAVPQTYFTAAKVTLEDMQKSDVLYENFSRFKEFFEKTNPGVRPNSNTPQSVDGILLVKAAGEKIGRGVLDPHALRAALETLTKVPGLQGVWTFTPESHGSSLSAGIAIVKHENGTWTPQ